MTNRGNFSQCDDDQLARPSRLALLVFASGDFAFNLYWQSIMLFLLFYYTDVLELPVTTATTIYAAASVWDGMANFFIGAMIDRWRRRALLRSWILVGSVPLALTFIATFAPPLWLSGSALAIIVLAHFAFRAAYAALNVPYLAMSAGISTASEDRALVAGARMIFGTLAWVSVARGTLPIGRALTGTTGPSAYFIAAVVFAVVATLLLALVASHYRQAPAVAPAPHIPLRCALGSIARNRAAVTLSLAMMAMIIGVTILNKSVLYYFKYFTNDAGAGEATLGWMGIASAGSMPGWIALQRRLGARALWFIAATMCIMGLLLFATVRFERAWSVELFLIALQVAMAGLHFSFWAMLPDTVEYGEHITGMRVEGATFGLAVLLQRVAIGAATLLLGAGFSGAGYLANATQSAATLADMRVTIALVPLAFLCLCATIMLFNPLGRGVHARIVSELAQR